MIVSSWNIRGLNDPYKRKAIWDMVNQNDIHIITILETRFKQNNREEMSVAR